MEVCLMHIEKPNEMSDRRASLFFPYDRSNQIFDPKHAQHCDDGRKGEGSNHLMQRSTGTANSIFPFTYATLVPVLYCAPYDLEAAEEIG